MEDSKGKGKKQYSAFDLAVMEEEILLLGNAFDEAPFDDNDEKIKIGRLMMRKFDVYWKALKLQNSNPKRT